MKTITSSLSSHPIPCTGSYKNDFGFTKQYDHIKVSHTSGQRVYLKVIKDSMKLSEIAKKMDFVDGNVIVKFGKKEIIIGTYSEY